MERGSIRYFESHQQEELESVGFRFARRQHQHGWRVPGLGFLPFIFQHRLDYEPSSRRSLRRLRTGCGICEATTIPEQNAGPLRQRVFTDPHPVA